MRPILLTALTAALLASTAALAAPAPVAVPPAPAPVAVPPAPAPVAVPPIAFVERTLPNGLRVFAIRDTTTANVAVQVWYDVGSKDDPAGRSGFAHMFEHLMFKSTRNMVPEQMDRLTEDVGGVNNATTDDDYTNYFEIVPSNHLERLIWAEAERMGSLVVEPTVLASERHVVEEELRQGQARPYGKLFQYYLPEANYTTHPYARPGIGAIADLDSATIGDIRAFHSLYYRPDNAVLVVAGNFQPAELDRWVDRYFGKLARPAYPVPRVTVAEPPRTKGKTLTVYEDNTPLPAVTLSWLIPPARSADTPALTVLDAVLSAGESSRLYQSLVYRDQLATQAGSSVDEKKGTGVFALYAILAGGKTAADGETALRREAAKLRDVEVSPAELDVAKNQLLTSTIQGRETAAGKAGAIARAVIIDGDPRAADRQLAAIAAVTAADVRRVAREYMPDDHAVAIRYLPKESANGAAGDTIAVAATVKPAALVAPANVAIVTPAPAASRVAPPAPGTPIAVPVPEVVEHKLPNGLRVAVANRPGVPLVSAVLVTGGGSADDARGRAGTASLAATLLTKGTTTRSATDIAQQVEALGGSIGSGAGWDGISLSLTVKSDRIEPGMAVFADVALNPKFAPDEIERARTQAIDDAGIALKDPRALARMVATHAVFGDTPYGHIASGTPGSLAKISRADMQSAYANAFRPEQSTLILVGDIGDAAALGLATRLFGGWKSGAVGSPTAYDAKIPAPRTIVVDLPGTSQASVIVARPGIARSDPRYYPAIVANTILGGGFSSRLSNEIRIKRGLAYNASSGLDARRGVGSLTAATATKNPSVPEVTGLITAEMRRLGTEPVGAAELATRKAALTGDFARGIETGAGLAGRLAGLAFDAVPFAELGKFSAGVESVTPEAVAATAKTLFDPSVASIVVAGDAKQFLPTFTATGTKVEVIPAASLDLDSPTLRR